MKNKIRYIVLATIFSVFLVSCKTEYMDPVPATAISDLTAFDTRARILSQVNGLYAAVKSGQYLGGRFHVYNEIRGDDFLNLQSNGVTGLATWNHSLSPATAEVQNLWGQVYLSINRFNVFLDGMAANRAEILDTRLLTQAEFDQFTGEALALRGMAYHHLLMLYARPYNQNPGALGVVLRLRGETDDTGNDLARSTVAETYVQIIADLDSALVLLPLSHGAGTANDAINVTRMQRNTVIALLTRVHLHQRDYAAVLAEGNKMVSATAPFVNAGGGVAYALAPTFVSVFRPPYTSSESIFSIPMTPTELPGVQNQLGHYFSIPPAGASEYPINLLSPIWTNTTDFPLTDARRVLTAIHPLPTVPPLPPVVSHTYLNKFNAMPHTDWAPVIRYAEVILNVAEAEARVNGVTDRAVNLLNAVHLRSNPTAIPLVRTDFASVDAFVNRLMAERNMEFMGEGIRNMDITRKVAPFGAKGAAAAVPPTSIAYVWPIPQSEINVNRLIVQNQ